MAFNLTDEQREDLLKYYSIPSKDQYFYAVKNIENTSAKSTLKQVLGGGGFKVVDTILCEEFDSVGMPFVSEWSIAETTRSSLDSSIDSSQAVLINHLINWGSAIKNSERILSDDSAEIFKLAYDSDLAQEEITVKPDEEWDSEVPELQWFAFQFSDRDSLNSTLIQSYLQDSNWATRMHLSEWLSPFVDSAGQSWDSSLHWTSGDDSGYGRWVGNSGS
jgi:hypothetical protein